MANISNHKVPDRAMQFAPFAALKGYYESVRKQERITQPKKELCDDDAKALSVKLNSISVGMSVIIRYYNIDSYVSISGVITEINEPYHRLKVNKTLIPFADIYSILNG